MSALITRDLLKVVVVVGGGGSLEVDRGVNQIGRLNIEGAVLILVQDRERRGRVDDGGVHVDGDVPVAVVDAFVQDAGSAGDIDGARVLGAQSVAVREGAVRLGRDLHVDGDVLAELLGVGGWDPEGGVGVVALLQEAGVAGGGRCESGGDEEAERGEDGDEGLLVGF